MKVQSEELISLQSKYREHRISLSESESKLIPLGNELKTVASEKEWLVSRVSDLEQQLQSKTEKWIAENEAHTDLVTDLRSKLYESQTQAQELEKRVGLMKVSNLIHFIVFPS